MTPTYTTVPFNKLVAGGDVNARSSGGREGIAELAASIKAKGLINPLTVRPVEGGKHEVVAGNRRLKALGALVKEGAIPRNHPVPALVREETDAEALDTSLAENDIRLPMHAVDRFEAFSRLADQGLRAEEIAARYALSERQVKQVLALGRLAPGVRDLWRKGKIDAEVAQAFTIEPRHELQEAALAELKKQGRHGFSEWAVRNRLSNDRPLAGGVPKDVLKAYLAAGGTLAEDLFGDQDRIEDGALLKKVESDWEAQKVAQHRALLAGHGWAWVAQDKELPEEWDYDWDRIEADIPDDVAARTEALHEAAWAAAGEERKRLLAEAKAAGLEATLAAFTREMRARSGVVLEVRDDGEVELTCGVVRPSADGTRDIESAIDEAREEDNGSVEDDYSGDDLPSVGELAGDDEEEGEKPAGAFAISQALTQSLSETRTLAAAKALARDPQLAMVAITAALLAQFSSPVAVRSEGASCVREHSDKPFATLFARLLKDEPDRLEARFAAAIATTLDLTDNTWRYKGRDSGCDALVSALSGADFIAAAREGFNAADYFKRASKAVALEAIAEIREGGAASGLAPEDVLAGMKKPELAAAAAEQAQRSGWLPPELRHPEYVLTAGAADGAGEPAGRSRRKRASAAA